MRRAGTQRDAGSEVRLGYRPPYDAAAMLAFFRTRAIAGMELVDDDSGPDLGAFPDAQARDAAAADVRTRLEGA